MSKGKKTRPRGTGVVSIKLTFVETSNFVKGNILIHTEGIGISQGYCGVSICSFLWQRKKSTRITHPSKVRRCTSSGKVAGKHATSSRSTERI